MGLTVTNGALDARRHRVFTRSSGAVLVQGTAPVTPKQVTVQIGDGAPVTVDVSADGTWSASVPAEPGTYTLRVESTSPGTDVLTERIVVGDATR